MSRPCSVSTPKRRDRRFADWQPAIFIDDVPKLRSAVEAAGESGPYYVEFRVTHPDGSVHWIAGKGEITKDEIGRAAPGSRCLLRHQRAQGP